MSVRKPSAQGPRLWAPRRGAQRLARPVVHERSAGFDREVPVLCKPSIAPQAAAAVF